MLKTIYKATKSYSFYKKYLNKRMPETIDNLMSMMKNSNQYDEFKREYETIKTIKRKDWNKKYKKEIIEIYNKPINYIEYDKKTNTNKNVRYYDLVRIITNEENIEVLMVIKDDKDRNQEMIRRGRWKKK